MEEYEKFCEKSLARIREAPLSADSYLPAGSDSISLIRFHGLAVLSPLLSIEKRKEMQQEKQKALDVEARKQVNRKKVLLTRVQEIIENVQLRKAPGGPTFDLWETEAVCSPPDVKSVDSLAPFPDRLPSPVEHSTLAGFERTAGIVPLASEDPHETNRTGAAREPEAFQPLKPKSSPTTSLETLIPASTHLAGEAQELSRVDEGAPDPYVLSLQNLMKKSREYIEQSRRSLRNSGKRSAPDSHSDKENDALRVPGRGTEKAQPTGKHCGSVIPDKPSLNKSNVLLQGASASAGNLRMAGWGSLPSADMLTPTGPAASVDPHPDGKGLPSSVLSSLSGSYAKIPSPEPSLSPQMHRRRSRPPSACHILINNPINACDLSPKGKGPAVGLAAHDTGEETRGPDRVPTFPVHDLGGAGPSQGCNSTNASEAVEETNQAGSSAGNQLEDKIPPGLAFGDGQSTADGRGPPRMDSTGPAVPATPEPGPDSPTVTSQNAAVAASVSEKNTSPSQTELNKSYDVKNPSPLLLQNQGSRPPAEPPTGAAASDQIPDNSLDKVKRRLDLDADSLQENFPFVVAAAVLEPDRPPLSEKRFPKACGYVNKNKTLEKASKEGEEMLRGKVLAFEEMRKRLEVQHAQQLSLLIAEQERLQKEMEEQEKLFKEKKVLLAEASGRAGGKAADAEWRRMSDAGLLEAMLAQADPRHPRNTSGSGLGPAALQHGLVPASDAPFYLWGPAASGLTKRSVPRPAGRAKAKWSQVLSAEVQAKFDKITAVARGFLTRRLMQTDKLKQLRQTVKDTMEFIRSFQSEAPLRRGVVSAQDASLQERVLAQLRAALYGIHDIFFVMDAAERMSILHHDREVRKEKMLRQLDKMKSPRVALSAATQKSLDRKKFMKAAEMGMPSKKFLVKQNPSEARVLQPNQGQNAPAHRLLSRQGAPQAAVKGGVPGRQKPSQSREPSRARSSGVYAGKIQRKRPNVATI